MSSIRALASVLHFPKRGGSSGPSFVRCSRGVIRLELWLACLFLLIVDSRVRGIGGRQPSDGGLCSCELSRTVPSSSFTVCSDRSSLANCAVNHDCFLTTPFFREGSEPMVGGCMLSPGNIWPGLELMLFRTEPGTSRLTKGFNVMIHAQTIPVFASIIDQKSRLTLA